MSRAERLAHLSLRFDIAAKATALESTDVRDTRTQHFLVDGRSEVQLGVIAAEQTASAEELSVCFLSQGCYSLAVSVYENELSNDELVGLRPLAGNAMLHLQVE